jgi:hypothetical protein
MVRCIIERPYKFNIHCFKLDLPLRRYDNPNTGRVDCCVVLSLCAENAKFGMLRLTNDIGELYTCTRHYVLLMGENITANTRKLSALCKYKVGHVSRTCKSTFLGAGRQ